VVVVDQNAHGDLDLEVHLNQAALFVEVNLIGQVLHQIDAPAMDIFKVFGFGGIGKIGIVETLPLVLNQYLYRILVHMKAEKNPLINILFVAVHNRIVHGFNRGDEDLAIEVAVNIIYLGKFIDKFLYFIDVINFGFDVNLLLHMVGGGLYTYFIL
jgi:hypothetical protein